MGSILDTLTGQDKVEINRPVRQGWISGEEKTHIHAESAHRDVFGNYTVTEKFTGAKYEIPAGQIGHIGGAVKVERDTL